MLKYLLSLYLLIYLIQASAQSTLIAKQGFESSEGSWPISNLSTPPCTQADDTWDFHTSLGEITPNEGLQFWGIQDLNGACGSSGFESIELTSFNISEFREVILSFDVQVLGYDNGDDMKYQLWLDGIEQPEVLFIEGQSNFNTLSWMRVQISIPNRTSQIKLKISVKQNGSDIAGLDNIELRGQLKLPCSELMISEYLEGTSSVNHRNNYIEIYNPTSDTIDLSSYQLIKYTGKSPDPSARLPLSKFIEPWATFLIEDNQEVLQVVSDLSTNSSVMDYNGDDKIALQKEDKIIDIVGHIGDSSNFGKNISLRRKSHIKNPTDDFDMVEWDTYPLEYLSDTGHHTSSCQGIIPEIEISGLGQPITDGNKSTSLVNSTYFGAWPVAKDTIIERLYTIRNTGDANLQIKEINIIENSSPQFSTNFDSISTIAPNDSLNLRIMYRPQQPVIHTAQVEIINNDSSENPFSFTIQGEGTKPADHPLIISQYYEGTANNKWIEVTNISNEPTPENTYYLALFWNEDAKHPIGMKPSRKHLIPSVSPGKSVRFCPTLNVTGPSYALDGNEIKSTVCGFTGNDILVISTSGDSSCWENRIDIIGSSDNWGTNLSMVRKYGCKAALPNTGFEDHEWLIYRYEDIDLAHSDTNQRLGIHHSGATTWHNGSWTNGKPDLFRKAIIADHYSTNNHGDIEVCVLKILETAHLNVTSSNTLTIQENLLVDGTLDIRDEGSLLMVSDQGQIENKGRIRIHKTTTRLNPYDYTYWSSPVEEAFLESVFKNSPKNSFFVFSAQEYTDLDQDDRDDDNNAWKSVSGAMEVGRGYTAMAPKTTPFLDYQQVEFEGKVNNGPIETQISLQNKTYPEQHHWNFIGNPYPSALDVELLLNDPLNKDLLSGTFYFWTHATPAAEDGSYTVSDYAMYTVGTGGIQAHENGSIPTQFISSCQGFFVEAFKEGVLSFNNSMRSKNGNDNFFKSSKNKKRVEEAKIWLNLSDHNGSFSQLLIGFVDGASNDLDKNFDGFRIGTNNPLQFYSICKNQPLAIQGVPIFQGSEIIPLGIKSSLSPASRLKIGLDPKSSIPGDHIIILQDHVLNISHDLNLSDYHFDLLTNEPVDNRFTLRFAPPTEVDSLPDIPTTKIRWHHHDNHIYVSTNNHDIISKVKIFDLNGRCLKNVDVQKQAVRIPWTGYSSRSIYILKTELEDARTFVNKIVP